MFKFILLCSFGLNAVQKDICPDWVMDPCKAAYMYYSLLVFDLICLQNNISYWASGGTLLGAFRHGGIISWDRDADVDVLSKDADKLFALTDTFAKYDITLIVSNENARLCAGEDDITIYVDIFFMDYQEGQYRLSGLEARRNWPIWTFFPNELEQFSRVSFGPIEIVIPTLGKGVLMRHYGNDALTTAAFYYQEGAYPVRITDFSPVEFDRELFQELLEDFHQVRGSGV